MPFSDEIRLLNDTENSLVARRNSTVDPAEKSVLTEQIQAVRDMRDMASFGTLFDTATTLNDLADIIETAAGALRRQPFDGVLGAYQSLLNRIAQLTGEAVQLEKPPHPDDEAPEEETEAEAALAQHYANCEVTASRIPVIDRYYLKPMLRNQALYEQVGGPLGIPWWFIGAVHGLEAAFNLSSHLHNGDPLSARTVQHPPGRPRTGAPPFSWTESATDALRLRNLENLDDWSIGKTLDRLERYNGLGYRKRGLPSPYLWSFSNHYVKGKFVSDGRFDPNAVSKQCGAGVMLKRLEDRGLITTKKPFDSDRGAMAAVTVDVTPATAAAPDTAPKLDIPSFVRRWANAELDFPGKIKKGDKDQRSARKVHRVQEWCSFHHCQTAIDGDFGPGTEASVKEFQEKMGLPQTGVVTERVWAAMTRPMQRALAPVAVNPGETIYDVVLRVAKLHLAIHPVEFKSRGEGNRGPWVRLYMHGNEGASQPWCAGFISHVVGQAAHAMGEAAPFRRQVGCDALARDAKDDDRFLLGSKLNTGTKRRAKIIPGSLFLVRRTSTDWTHVGFVTDVGDEHFSTIEGNTDDSGSREGVEVCARKRGYSKRDFVLLV